MTWGSSGDCGYRQGVLENSNFGQNLSAMNPSYFTRSPTTVSFPQLAGTGLCGGNERVTRVREEIGADFALAGIYSTCLTNKMALRNVRLVGGRCADHCLICTSTSCSSCAGLYGPAGDRCECPEKATPSGVCLTSCRLHEIAVSSSCRACGELMLGCLVCTSVTSCGRCRASMILISGACLQTQ
jgi:hypothetical protein